MALADQDAPVVLADLDRESGLVRFPPAVDAARYQRALVIVREAGQPIGSARVALVNGEVQPDVVDRLARHDWPRPSIDPVPDGVAVSVVICTVDRPRDVHQTVMSILHGSYPVHQVVVVDNSADARNTQNLAELSRLDGRIVSAHCPTPGLSAARNLGARLSTGSVLAFTDDDVVAEPQWVAGLVGALAAGPADVATGLILPAELDTRAQQMCARAGGYGKGFVPRDFTVDAGADDPLFPYAMGSFGSGANIAVTAAAFARLGGFDEALGAGTRSRGGEDLDLFVRAIVSGMRIRYTPTAVIRHTDLRAMDAFARQRYSYGVGLASVLTKLALQGHARSMMHRAVPGARHLIAPTSAKNANKQGAYPLWLTGLEWAGIAYGPLAYLQSRRRHAGRGTSGRVALDPAGATGETP